MNHLKLSVNLKVFIQYKLLAYISNISFLLFLTDRFLPRSGPQYFLLNLLVSIDSHNYLMISCNSMTSNFHLHNSGNLSLKDFNAVSPDKSILRLDGIGFETFQGYKKQYQIAFMNKLISNSRAFIFQSNFAKAIFQDYYGDLISLKPHRVIINGSSRFYSGINQNSLIANHNIHLPTRYYVVAGRNVPRKRIDQIINLFKMLPQYNLVVLSDVRPSLQRFPNIYPIGLVAPEIARYIISNSIALIHLIFMIGALMLLLMLFMMVLLLYVLIMEAHRKSLISHQISTISFENTLTPTPPWISYVNLQFPQYLLTLLLMH